MVSNELVLPEMPVIAMDMSIERILSFATLPLRRLVATCVLGSLCLAAPGAEARTPQVRIVRNADLSFGTFMVFGSGSRSVTVSGLVSDQAIVPLEGSLARPASFTVEYDRGNESRHSLDIAVELVLMAPAQVRTGGVEAKLSAFETDLPGHLNVRAGEVVRIDLANCRSRICSRQFNIGARLDVVRQFGGADIVIPLDIDARVISAERQ